MNSFDNNLRRLRNRKNLKQEELAERMHVSRQTISGWETGRRQPDLDTLKKLADALDADIHELIYGSKPEEYPKFQRKYVLRTAVSGVLAAVPALLWMLLGPYFKVIFATFHWGLGLTVFYCLIPQVGAFAFGSLFPSMIQLFLPVSMKKHTAMWCLKIGLTAILPVALFWLSVPPCSRWILYPLGKACLTILLPAISGVLITLAITYKPADNCLNC